MKSLLLVTLLGLACTEFIPIHWEGLPSILAFSSPQIHRHYYMDYPEDAALPETNVTYYTYEFNYAQHFHYVTLHLQNSGFADTPASRNAGRAVFHPHNVSSHANDSFTHKIHENATISEMFDHVYSYVHADHTHYISGYDVKNMAWNSFPNWFQEKILSEGESWIDYSQQAFLHPQSVKQHVQEPVPDPFAPPPPPKRYLKFPTHKNASSGEYLTSDVELKYNMSRELMVNKSIERFVYVNSENTFYIPSLDSEGQVTTETLKSSTSRAMNGSTWLSNSSSPQSDNTSVVIRYQTKLWRFVHIHNVYFSQGKEATEQPPTPAPEEPPLVIPGMKPLHPLTNAVYMNYEHPTNHVDSASKFYLYGYANLSQEHKQELLSDGSMKTLSTPLKGEYHEYRVAPEQSSSSATTASYEFYYCNYVHHHTLLYGRANSPYAAQQTLLAGEIDTAVVSQQKEALSGWTALLCVLMLGGFVLLMKKALQKEVSREIRYVAMNDPLLSQ